MVAFLRLALRPAFFFSLLLLTVFYGTLLMMLDTFAGFAGGRNGLLSYGEGPTRAVSLLPYYLLWVLPLSLGLVVGHVVHDIRHRFFAWTLPGLSARLKATIVGIAFLTAVGWSAVFRGQLGDVGALSSFAGAGLLFMVSASLWTSWRATLATWAVLIPAVLWIDELFRFIRAQPLVWTVVALGGAVICFDRGFNRSSWRRRPFLPFYSRLDQWNLVEATRRENERLTRSSRTGRWRVSYLGAEPHNWARAARYERFGAASPWKWMALSSAGLVVPGLLGLSLLLLRQPSLETGLDAAYYALFGGAAPPPTPLPTTTLSPALTLLLLGSGAFALVLGLTPQLQRGWVYPLSRRLRGLIAYRTSLAVNVGVAVRGLVIFGAYGALVALLRGRTGVLDSVPIFARGVIALLILVPLLQWIDLQLARASPQRWSSWAIPVRLVLGLSFSFLVASLTSAWSIVFADIPLPVQAGLLCAIVLLTQGLYFVAVMSHFARRDLI